MPCNDTCTVIRLFTFARYVNRIGKLFPQEDDWLPAHNLVQDSACRKWRVFSQPPPSEPLVPPPKLRDRVIWLAVAEPVSQKSNETPMKSKTDESAEKKPHPPQQSLKIVLFCWPRPRLASFPPVYPFPLRWHSGAGCLFLFLFARNCFLTVLSQQPKYDYRNSWWIGNTCTKMQHQKLGYYLFVYQCNFQFQKRNDFCFLWCKSPQLLFPAHFLLFLSNLSLNTMCCGVCLHWKPKSLWGDRWQFVFLLIDRLIVNTNYLVFCCKEGDMTMDMLKIHRFWAQKLGCYHTRVLPILKRSR